MCFVPFAVSRALPQLFQHPLRSMVTTVCPESEYRRRGSCFHLLLLLLLLSDGCIYDADNQKRIAYLAGKGHQLINHSWSHPVSLLLYILLTVVS